MNLKSFVLAGFASIVSTVALASSENFTKSFVEDNDLWKEDGRLERVSPVTEQLFRDIVKIGYELYEPFAKANHETLTINPNWDDATVNANCSRSGGKVTVNMYGGLARRPEVNAEGFALVLCHELGHAYGGTPYIQPTRKMSAEGQADYYGSKECMAKVIARISGDSASMDITPYIQNKCNEKYQNDPQGYDICLRQMAGAQSLGNLLATIKKEASPNFETPDPTVVKQTLTSYPDTIQCRLDTYHNGILGMLRPACWFNK